MPSHEGNIDSPAVNPELVDRFVGAYLADEIKGNVSPRTSEANTLWMHTLTSGTPQDDIIRASEEALRIINTPSEKHD